MSSKASPSHGASTGVAQAEFDVVLQHIQQAQQKAFTHANTVERSSLGIILSPVLRELYPDIKQTVKDNYVLEFLGLPEAHSESDMQKALSRNLSPALVAQYHLQLPDKKVLQAKLHELLAAEGVSQ